jgi:hypothetical protein
MEFFQTRTGQIFYEKQLPSLIKELEGLQKEIAELRKPKESMVIVIKDEWDLGKTIKEHTEKGWTLKHYIPQHLEVDSQQIVSTVLVFEK